MSTGRTSTGPTSTGPTSTGRSLPLAGTTVVDFTQVYLGPSCTQLLGDFGARVIKIERPGTGDLSRTSIPDRAGLDNPIFLSINRNKQSAAINLRTDQGREVVLKLIAQADVVVNNFRPGVMERMGFGYEALRAINPRIIWASATGFGEQGPYRHKGGQDVLAQAYSGVMWRRQSDDLPLSVYPTTLCDYTTGMHLLQAILLALIARDRDGEGQKVLVSMYDSMLHMQMQEACMLLNRGYEWNWARMPLCGVFETTTGAVCIVGAFKENPLRDICAALQLEDLSLREEFSGPERQIENREAIQAIFRERFRTSSTEHWVRALEAEDVLCAPVMTLEAALSDEQTQTNGMIVEVEHPRAGRVRVLNTPIHMEGTAATTYRPPPMLGEHSATVLEDLGYSREEIKRLFDQGVLGGEMNR